MTNRLDYNTEEFDKLKTSQLKRMADYWLRQYLLKNSESKKGKMYRCPIKKKLYPPNKMHVAHFIDRGHMNTRYDLDNVCLISEESNMWDAQIPMEGYKSKHHKEYEEYLGPDKVERLLHKSKEIRRLRFEDYIELIKKFKNESI